MEDVSQKIDIEFLNREDFKLKNQITQDNVPTLTRAQFERMSSRNGFSDGRTMRKIASIPHLELIKAKSEGWNLNDKNELRRWIELHPQYMTVRSLSPQGNEGRIIVN